MSDAEETETAATDTTEALAQSDEAESTQEEIVVADSKEPVAPEATAPKKGAGKMPVILGAAIALVAIVAVALSTTAFSPQTKADKLYEQGSYAEALEAYTAIGDEDKNGAKMSDCRYWMFVNWLLAEGPYKTSQGEVTWTVEGYSNGDIKCSLDGDIAEKSYVGMDEQWTMTVHHSETSADLSATCKVKILGRTINESGTGKIDLPSYAYDREITFDDYENTGTTTGTSVIKSNSGTVSKMIQKGLLGALSASGTGATLSDLGFTGLQ